MLAYTSTEKELERSFLLKPDLLLNISKYFMEKILILFQNQINEEKKEFGLFIRTLSKICLKVYFMHSLSSKREIIAPIL